MSDATKIEMDRVLAALSCLGIEDHKTIRSVVLDPHNVTVTRVRLNEAGARYIGEDGALAVEITVMSILYPKRPATAADLRMPDLTDEERAAFLAAGTAP